MSGEQDKRQHKRIQRQLVAHFHVRPHDPSGDKEWDIVTVRNLSAGGVLFNYDKELPEGCEVDFKINFPGAEEQVICSGRIVRIDEVGDYGILPTAAVFTDIGDHDKQVINDIAAKLHIGEPTGTVFDKDWEEDQ